MNYSVLIVAAGSGQRMGLGYNKVFYPLKEGVTVLQKTLRIFIEDKRCKQVVLVMGKEDLPRAVEENGTKKILYVLGGETRQESVFNGLMAVSEPQVLIHDGARPFLKQESLELLLTTLESEKACILAVPVKDTIKEVEDGYIVKTPPRKQLVQAQTPQAFETCLILDCYKKARKEKTEVTDDAQVIEMFSTIKIKIVEGDYGNIKITTMEDLAS